MGVKPNMGKSCIRFTKLDKIPLDTIIGLIQNFPVEEYIKRYELVKKWQDLNKERTKYCKI